MPSNFKINQSLGSSTIIDINCGILTMNNYLYITKTDTSGRNNLVTNLINISNR